MGLVLRNDTEQLAHGWHPLLSCAEVSDSPVRARLLGRNWVAVRMDGAVRVFLDRCPHRNARLSDGTLVGGRLECPYHGWRFDGDGRCAFIPALGEDAAVPPTAHLSGVPVQERYGLVWIAPDTPVRGIIDIPEFDDPSLQVMWLPRADISATAGQFVDNFLDFGHFPFVHAGTFGAGEDKGISPYEVRTGPDGWSFVVEYPHSIRNHEDPLVATGEHPLVQPRLMRYEFAAPFSITLRLDFPLTGMMNLLVVFLQPLDADSTRLYCAMVRNDCDTPEKIAAAVDYELAIVAEDLAIIEHLWNNEIPLEAGQAHTRADRNTIEFRRIMARLITSFPAP